MKAGERHHLKTNEFAVLYRGNHQSRPLALERQSREVVIPLHRSLLPT